MSFSWCDMQRRLANQCAVGFRMRLIGRTLLSRYGCVRSPSKVGGKSLWSSSPETFTMPLPPFWIRSLAVISNVFSPVLKISPSTTLPEKLPRRDTAERGFKSRMGERSNSFEQMASRPFHWTLGEVSTGNDRLTEGSGCCTMMK